ncbi:hypothetical protein FB451DRAFT_1419624 [Mycena latifolia]|nr:hypothetical protein FB451DRAFT_1419624 [Mycena latifolia]
MNDTLEEVLLDRVLFAWMVAIAASVAPASDAFRFDLSGSPLAAPLHSSLPTHLGLHHHAWAAVWRAEVAWLEGARVNSVRGGEKEREQCALAVKAAFETGGGKDHVVVEAAVATFTSRLKDFGRGGALKLKELARCAETLMAVIRLWLACLPPATDGPSAFRAAVQLAIRAALGSLCGPGYVLFRPLSSLLASYLRLSQRLPDVSQDVWMAQALSILFRLLPGDEEFALQVTQEVLDLITPQWAMSRELPIPQAIWDKGGLSRIKPFLARALKPRDDVHIGPSCMSPNCIKHATTQRLPSPSSAFSREYGLPVPRDWTLSPLDHLLRSGTSPVFKDLPPSWDASEVDVTLCSRRYPVKFPLGSRSWTSF